MGAPEPPAPVAGRVLIAEEVLLLVLDDESGKKSIGSEKLGPALGAALLVELALRERIGVTPHSDGRRGRVTITSTAPTDDPELDRALAHLVEHEDTKVSHLVSDLSGKRVTKGLADRLLARLVAGGVLGLERSRVLGLRSWPTRDPAPEEEIRRRLQMALVDRTTPTERTVALISLLQATGRLDKVAMTGDRLDKKALRARAKELSEGDWAAAAVKAAIDEVYAMMAAAASVGATGGGDGGS